MKIVKRLSDNAVFFLEDNNSRISFIEGVLRVENTTVPDITDDLYTIESNVTHPDVWIGGGVLSYSDSWDVLNQEIFDKKTSEIAAVENDIIYSANLKKIEELKVKRDEIIHTPLNNVKVAKPENREDILNTIRVFDTVSQNGVIPWTMADDTTKNLTLADLEAVESGYILRKAQVFFQYQQLRAALELADTIDDIESVGFE